MKRILLRAHAWLVALAVVLGGCATIPREGGVSVSLVSVVPQQSSLFETTARLTLRFINETARPLELAGSTHRIYINGAYVGRAVTNERLTIPQLGTMTQTMDAHLENLALMRKAQELGNATVVEYRIDSRLLPLADERAIGATATGQLDLSGFIGPVPASAR